MEQYRYFVHVVKEHVEQGDRVVVCTHAPEWTTLSHSAQLLGRKWQASEL